MQDGADALLPWRGLERSGDAFEQELRTFAVRRENVFLFELTGSELTWRRKDPAEGPVWPNSWHRAAMEHRAAIYHGFLAQALRVFGIRGRAVFAINMDDISDPAPDLPMFVFQRPRGSRNLLLPDVELIGEQFFHGEEFDDPIPLERKAHRAVFVGSTTGEMVVPWQDEAEVANARVRAALAFRHVPEVDFFLPSIVQPDPAVHAAIAAAGLTGRRLSWQEQFGYRFLLSLDGHGAACSRLEIALRSQAVPVKFASEHELFFFPGLRPWEHYLPADGADDVVALIRDTKPSVLADIASQSRRFARAHLSRIAVLRYTAALLAAYIERFGRDFHMDGPGGFWIDGYAHFAGLGNRWSAPDGWIEAPDGAAIEAVVLEPALPIQGADLRYAPVGADGREGPERQGFGFCGTRGRSTPLHGLRLSLNGPLAERLRYAARFADGRETGMVGSGTPLFSDAALTGLRIRVR